MASEDTTTLREALERIAALRQSCERHFPCPRGDDCDGTIPVAAQIASEALAATSEPEYERRRTKPGPWERI